MTAKTFNKIFVTFKYLLAGALLCLILIPSGYWFLKLYKDVVVGENKIAVNDSYSAFFGAFFAFALGAIASIAKKYYARQVKHYNSLCRLQDIYTKVGSIIHDNIYLLPGFRTTIVSGNVYTSFPKAIYLDDYAYEGVSDLGIINQTAIVNSDIRRLNDDREMLVDWYIVLRKLYITGAMDKPTYIARSTELADNLKMYQVGSQVLTDDILSLLAVILNRIELDKPIFVKITEFFTNLFRLQVDENLHKEAIAVIKKDLDQSSTESLPRIERMIQMKSKIKD